MAEYGWTPTPEQRRPQGLPRPRGPLSAWLVDRLAGPPRDVGHAPAYDGDPVHGEDAAIALYTLYELHYRGFDGVDDGWEWEPSLLAARAGLERDFLQRLADLVGPLPRALDLQEGLQQALAGVPGPSLSRYAEDEATLEQVRELAAHRSAWQLKEADPHSWALPRLGGRAKAALVEIQKEEYGDGVERDMHQVLFGLTMVELGLDPSYGAYLDHLPGVTLATVNLVSLFGLHRRWRGALVGHLAAFEMTSVVPMGNYAGALKRLGLSTDARHFYEVHVVADAHHCTLAAESLAGGLVEAEPELAPQVVFGAAAVSVLERAFADHALAAFAEDQCSLLEPLDAHDLKNGVA